MLLKDRILARTDQPIRQIILYGSRAQGSGRPDSASIKVGALTIRGGCVGHGGDGIRGNQRGHWRLGLSST